MPARASVAPALLVLWAAACATAGHGPAAPALPTASQPPAEPAPPPAPAVPVVVPEPRVALVLGGGAARGFAHIGVIRVLEQERIPVDLVVGTSVGSLIGALYASTRDSFELEWTAFQLGQDDIFDFRLMNAITGMGYARGEQLEAWVRSKVKQERIEQLPIPFAAVATDLNWGGKVVLDQGSVAKAVHASSAIPGVFEPVTHAGKLLVDGGIVDNIPIDVARAKGADLVIAVDISEDVGNTAIKNALDVILQATNILFAENVAHLRGGADVLVEPKVGSVGMLDFNKKKYCMQAGIEAARKAVPRIREAIEAWKARRAAAAPRS
ncbi:MAG TPA: patatin-like phospholipase family protein [Anaeromyxobacter sp.]|nr:patatin-like phospholipase family protein [Anaeromyxobacter sp.]